jgi:hypothetical protein
MAAEHVRIGYEVAACADAQRHALDIELRRSQEDKGQKDPPSATLRALGKPDLKSSRQGRFQGKACACFEQGGHAPERNSAGFRRGRAHIVRGKFASNVVGIHKGKGRIEIA